MTLSDLSKSQRTFWQRFKSNLWIAFTCWVVWFVAKGVLILIYAGSGMPFTPQVANVITVAALTIAAAWYVWRYMPRRAGMPRRTADVEIRLAPTQLVPTQIDRLTDTRALAVRMDHIDSGAMWWTGKGRLRTGSGLWRRLAAVLGIGFVLVFAWLIETHQGEQSLGTGRLSQDEHQKRDYVPPEAVKAYNSGDYVTALRLYRQSADRGSATAQNIVGAMISNGYGVQRNDAEAVKWWRLAAGQGLASAQNNLGVAYWNGLGVPRDYAEAALWFRLAANQGFANAQDNLGSMYYLGPLPRDYVEAEKWFRLAANQRNADAQYWLGYMYYTGEGVQRDYFEAYVWFSLSEALGFDTAGQMKALVEPSLTSARISEARRVAEKWKADH